MLIVFEISILCPRGIEFKKIMSNHLCSFRILLGYEADLAPYWTTKSVAAAAPDDD